MGLDIVAYSRLRLLPPRDTEDDEAEDDEAEAGGAVAHVYAGDFDRLGGMTPGRYAAQTLADVWWRGEHGGAPLPDAERERVDGYVAKALEAKKAECPGDAAVLANPDFASEEHSFRAGSYSSYNRWREALCRFALGCEPEDVWESPDSFAGKPFMELIHFSDAEGCLGGTVAVKLAKDFREHLAAARAAELDGFFPLYEAWQEAFELAAQDGVVIFG